VEDDVNWPRGGMSSIGGRDRVVLFEHPLSNIFFFTQFASYWDCLPPELALPIRTMAIKQFWIDEREKELRQQLLQDIVNYRKLREAWGLGPIKLLKSQGILQIKGVFVDYENRPQTALLGQGSLDNALKRVHHVKSFYP